MGIGNGAPPRGRQGVGMWLLLGLLGVAVAAGVGDMFIRPEDEDTLDDPMALESGDSAYDLAGDTGDLMDDTDDGAAADALEVTADEDDLADDGLGDGLDAQVADDQAVAVDPAPGTAATGAGDPGPGAAPAPMIGPAPLGDPGNALQADAPPADAPDPDAPEAGAPVATEDFPGPGEGEWISTDAPPIPPRDSVIDVGDDGATLPGGEGDDTLLGGKGADWLEGLGGDDSIDGAGGADTLIGGLGDDTLTAGDGDDQLLGDSGADILDGGAGADSLTGGSGADILNGGADDDTLEGGADDDKLDGGEGRDLLMAGDGNDVLDGGNDHGEQDFLNAGDGNDTLHLGGNDLASGGGGADDFVLDGWMDGDNPAVISDFETGVDRLMVAWDGQGTEPAIETVYDAAAGGLRVLIDGEAVALLQGVTTLDPSTIALRPATAQAG